MIFPIISLKTLFNFSMTAGRMLGPGHPGMMEPMGHVIEEEKKPKTKKRKKKKAETPVKKDDKSKVQFTKFSRVQ